MKKTILLALLLCLTSCYTQKWASKKIGKVAYEQPIILAQECLSRFPSKDSIHESIEYIQGATVLNYDTVEIKCDTVQLPSKIIRIPCPPSKVRVDTFREEKITTEQDQRVEKILTHQIDSLKTQTIESNLKVKNKNKHITILSSILGIIVLLYIIKLYITKKPF